MASTRGAASATPCPSPWTPRPVPATHPRAHGCAARRRGLGAGGGGEIYHFTEQTPLEAAALARARIRGAAMSCRGPRRPAEDPETTRLEALWSARLATPTRSATRPPASGGASGATLRRVPGGRRRALEVGCNLGANLAQDVFERAPPGVVCGVDVNPGRWGRLRHAPGVAQPVARRRAQLFRSARRARPGLHGRPAHPPAARRVAGGDGGEIVTLLAPLRPLRRVLRGRADRGPVPRPERCRVLLEAARFRQACTRESSRASRCASERSLSRAEGWDDVTF